MFNPLVSVIIPNYNHAKYLEQRIETVLNQTYQNIEVIILDDKSTDNSIDIIEKYRNNPKVSQIVFNETNTGSPFKQWDKGINLAKGDVIWIAESDDYNELTFLAELINEWQKHNNVVIAYSNYVKFWDNDYIYFKERKSRYYTGNTFVKNRMSRTCLIKNASGTIFSKEAYNKISNEYLSFKSAGDYMFWVELLMHGNIVKVNKNLTYFRQHPSSVTSKNTTNGILALEDKKILDFITKKYSLNDWQSKMAIYSHAIYYKNCQFIDTNISKIVSETWDINASMWIPNKHILWLIGAFERHTGILI